MACGLQSARGAVEVPVPLESGPPEREQAGPPVILVADGEPLYRWFAGELLCDAGYRVVLLERGADVRDYIARRGPVSLALLDLHLPDEDGRDLAAALHAMAPRLPMVVLASGEIPQRPGDHLLTVPLVVKPSDGAHLLALVREVPGPER
jgi:DNA-binding response OmpR family regulator